jgi:isopropylmalate/homocitrate/citramalate synthase
MNKAGKTVAIAGQRSGPRDGLQSIAAMMSTSDKLRWVSALHSAGVR